MVGDVKVFEMMGVCLGFFKLKTLHLGLSPLYTMTHGHCF